MHPSRAEASIARGTDCAAILYTLAAWTPSTAACLQCPISIYNDSVNACRLSRLTPLKPTGDSLCSAYKGGHEKRKISLKGGTLLLSLLFVVNMIQTASGCFANSQRVVSPSLCRDTCFKTDAAITNTTSPHSMWTSPARWGTHTPPAICAMRSMELEK